MIFLQLVGLNGHPVAINPDLLETYEPAGEGVSVLYVNGRTVTVKASYEQVNTELDRLGFQA